MMKSNLVLLLFFIISFTSPAQQAQVEGTWQGLLKVQGMEITLVFHITHTDDGLKTIMDSPDQGAFGIQVDQTAFEADSLKMVIPSAGIVYKGMLKNGIIKGIFIQSGMEFSLDLGRDKPEKTALVRPQEPKEPFPYLAEEIYFINEEAGITLAGTLTLPQKDGSFPAVILITGSGPQNRNEELLGHKPFLVIADYLTRKGIAVLRFDDRGVAESEGNFATATSYDFATDVEAALAYLRKRPEIHPTQIGLVGHSEGGIIAPIVASQNPDEVGFIVLLAGTGIRGDQLLLQQQVLVSQAMGMKEDKIQKNSRINQNIFELIQQETDTVVLNPQIHRLLEEALSDADAGIPEGMTKEQFLQQQYTQITSPWMLSFLQLDPALYLEKVKCPVLAVNGSNDLQVPPSNLKAIEEALIRGGNHNVTVKEFPGLNHLFQECETGSPANYASIEQTIAPEVLEKMSSWIIDVTQP